MCPGGHEGAGMRKSGTTDRYRFFCRKKCISYRLLGRIRDEILWALRVYDMFVIQWQDALREDCAQKRMEVDENRNQGGP